MTAFAPIDIEDELRQALDSEGCPVFAPPIPDNLSTRVPCALCVRRGGTRRGLVVDVSNMEIYVWAETDAESMYHANRLVGELTQLQFTHDLIHRIDIIGQPYQSNDPSHPTLARTAMTIQVYSTSERS